MAVPVYFFVDLNFELAQSCRANPPTCLLRVVNNNYYPTVKRRVKNHECFSTSAFSSLFISEDYGLDHSYTLQET